MSIKKSIAGRSKKSEAQKVNERFSENALRMMRKRYLLKREDGSQESPADMFGRIAHALARIEKKYGRNEEFIKKTEREFFEIMSRKEYTPAGRTITNAGASTPVVANCIVLPVLDSMESIFQTLKDAALLQQAGSGLGFDFSHLRPAMTRTRKSNGVASGPVSFLMVYNEAFSVIKQQGRHGANMAMMQIDHPDAIDFIRAKEVEGSIRNFNISIKITDEFMNALIERPYEQWYCRWKENRMKPHKVLRAPNGSVIGIEDIDITAQELFDELVNYAWLNGEPGIVFIDEVNRTNPLPGLGTIDCSNPCGEQFLHHYDNCNLGSINLAKFVKNGEMDWTRLRRVTKIATRMLDNVVDTFNFPVRQVNETAKKNRRIGLGIMGFADMLYQLRIPYDSYEGLTMAEKAMKMITDASHEMSEELAKEKGVFGNWDLSVYKTEKTKLRNAALTTVAPTGSISMMFDCSSGIEPNFALSYVKQDKDGHQYYYFNQHFEEALKQHEISDEQKESIKAHIADTGSIQALADLPEELRRTFVVAMDISAEDHVKMQASFQKHVDNSISKTVNFANSATKEDIKNGFIMAWKLKCKACTIYRDGSRTIQILNLGTGENIKAPTELGAKGEIKEARPLTEVPLNLEADTTRIEPRSRPGVMSGRTHKVKTGYGNLYITINNDENSMPFEVFATIGKTGGFFQEQSEAICRMISLALRSGIKVEEVINNLKGIRGPMPMLTAKGTILSLPDAIGQTLEEHVRLNGHGTPRLLEAKHKEEVAVAKSKNETIAPVYRKKSIADFGMMPGCPDCGSHLVMAEGCMSCKNCGFSRCM